MRRMSTPPHHLLPARPALAGPWGVDKSKKQLLV